MEVLYKYCLYNVDPESETQSPARPAVQSCSKSFVANRADFSPGVYPGLVFMPVKCSNLFILNLQCLYVDKFNI